MQAELTERLRTLYAPVATLAAARAAAATARPFVLGLCGPQGSGKTTGAAVLCDLLQATGLRTAILPLDDLYLPRAERVAMAERVHPLFAIRGPPGAHDPALGVRLLNALGRPGEVRLPRFDKAADDRAPEPRTLQGPFDAVIFEGWCVGARAQPTADLAEPVNRLEAEEDADGGWRRFANAQLAGPYAPLFERIDFLVLLRAPTFAVVAEWRIEQEQALRESGAGGKGIQGDAQIHRFVQHYERLTRWIDVEMPQRADVVIQLDANRRPCTGLQHAGNGAEA